MTRLLTLTTVATLALYGGAYKIPEQSLNSIALGAAYIAHTQGADTAYFNPAAMAFMDAHRYVEGGVTLAHLPANVYTLTPPYSGRSIVENLPIPFGHYVAAPMGRWRWGVSLTAPGGLRKRWESPYQKLYAQEFDLKILELSPACSYKLSDRLAVGGGLRMIYSQGKVYSDGGTIAPIKREMKGDTLAFGYNLALAYKPTDDINMALTYRSNIDLTEKGQANLYFNGIGRQYDAEVTVPLPAALNIAIAKTWGERFTLEAVYERTYWSTYEALDFVYAQPVLNPFLQQAFDMPLARRWHDSNAYRIGATVAMDNRLTAMFGFTIDESPVPTDTIGFELPDSDAKIISMGFRYRQRDDLSWGAALLYDVKSTRTIPRGVAENRILANGGTFEEGGAVLLTLGLSYRY